MCVDIWACEGAASFFTGVDAEESARVRGAGEHRCIAPTAHTGGRGGRASRRAMVSGGKAASTATAGDNLFHSATARLDSRRHPITDACLRSGSVKKKKKRLRRNTETAIYK